MDFGGPSSSPSGGDKPSPSQILGEVCPRAGGAIAICHGAQDLTKTCFMRVQVQRQVQVAQFQEFVSVNFPCFLGSVAWPRGASEPDVIDHAVHVQTVRDKCFEKCVTKPSSSLGSSEQQCLARCCDRYAEVRLHCMQTTIAKAYINDSDMTVHVQATQIVMRSVLQS